MRLHAAFVLLIVLTSFQLARPAAATDVDLYARLLLRHTRVTSDMAGTRVDYASLRDDPEWTALVSSLAMPGEAAPEGRAEAIAFWINAYNILAIDTVAAAYPIKSIRDLNLVMSPIWRKKVGTVAGRPRSLDEIEHEILRPMGEPRIHAALVCASASCPTLLREPWRADGLDARLDAAMQGWLRDPRKGFKLDRESKTVWLSSVFDWFGVDFGDGEPELLLYIEPHLPRQDRDWLRSNGDVVDVEYLPYDWRLNGLDRSIPASPSPLRAAPRAESLR